MPGGQSRGGASIEPFWGGRSSQRAVSTPASPPLPPLESPPTPAIVKLWQFLQKQWSSTRTRCARYACFPLRPPGLCRGMGSAQYPDGRGLGAGHGGCALRKLGRPALGVIFRALWGSAPVCTRYRASPSATSRTTGTRRNWCGARCTTRRPAAPPAPVYCHRMGTGGQGPAATRSAKGPRLWPAGRRRQGCV